MSLVGTRPISDVMRIYNRQKSEKPGGILLITFLKYVLIIINLKV